MIPAEELYTDDIGYADDEDKRAIIDEVNPDALLADGFEEALIGIAYRCGQEPLALYDKDKVIEILMKRDGMDYVDAIEYFEYNMIGAWMGEGTPVFDELF